MITFVSETGKTDLFQSTVLKGNVVKFDNSSRCCNLLCFELS